MYSVIWVDVSSYKCMHLNLHLFKSTGPSKYIQTTNNFKILLVQFSVSCCDSAVPMLRFASATKKKEKEKNM